MPPPSVPSLALPFLESTNPLYPLASPIYPLPVFPPAGSPPPLPYPPREGEWGKREEGTYLFVFSTTYLIQSEEGSSNKNIVHYFRLISRKWRCSRNLQIHVGIFGNFCPFWGSRRGREGKWVAEGGGAKKRECLAPLGQI